MYKDDFLVCLLQASKQAGKREYIVHAEDTLSRKERSASSA
jgi:hypothetical protein